jgi:hypothetical protein
MRVIRRTTSDGRNRLRAEHKSVAAYDAAQSPAAAETCRKLHVEIERTLPRATSKVWHGHPVWFVGETPVVGYRARAKDGVVLLFWNGQALDAAALTGRQIQGGSSLLCGGVRHRGRLTSTLVEAGANEALGRQRGSRSESARSGARLIGDCRDPTGSSS